MKLKIADYTYFFIVIFICHFQNVCSNPEISISENNQSNEQVIPNESPKIDNDEDLSLDDEKLMEEIIEIMSFSYKEIIDISALYFCGLVVDWDKLCEHMSTLFHKDFFKLLKLFSWYVPAILKNPKISNITKVKRLTVVAVCIFCCGYISKEILQAKGNMKNIKIYEDQISFMSRK